MKKGQLITLLLAMGITQANAEKIAVSIPDDAGIEMPADDIAGFISAVQTKQTDLLKNDSEFLKSLDTPIQKKYQDIQFRKLKQVFGLTEEEIKDMDYEAALKFGRDKISKTDNKTLDELQKKNIELETELKKVREEEIPAIKGEVDTAKANIELENLLVKNIIPKDKKLRVSVDGALPAFKAILAAKGLKLVKNTEGGMDVVVIETNLKLQSADKTKIVTFEELRDAELKNLGMIEESGAPSGKPNPLNNTEVNGGKGEENKVQSPHLAKAEAHLSGLKETMAKKAD